MCGFRWYERCCFIAMALVESGSVFRPSFVRRYRRVGCAFVLGACAFAGVAAAQPTSGPERHPERVLAEHTFLTPTVFPSPFIGTSFLLRQGFVSVEIPDFPISSGTTTDVSLLGQTEQIEASLRFRDRFEVIVDAGGQALVGSSVRSSLAGGGSFAFRLGGGAQVRLLREQSRGTELAVRAHGSYGPGALLDILQLVSAVIEQDPDDTQSVVNREDIRKYIVRDTVRGQADLFVLLAQRLSPTFGLQAALGGAYTWSTIDFFDAQASDNVEVTTRSLDPEANVALGANLDPLLPLGFLAEYSLRVGRRTLPGSESAERTASHVVALGVQIVHPQFQVGLTTARSFAIEPIERADGSGGLLKSGTPSFKAVQLGLEFTWW